MNTINGFATSMSPPLVCGGLSVSRSAVIISGWSDWMPDLRVALWVAWTMYVHEGPNLRGVSVNPSSTGCDRVFYCVLLKAVDGTKCGVLNVEATLAKDSQFTFNSRASILGVTSFGPHHRRNWL